MYGRMMPSDRWYQGMIAQCRMRMMWVMMTEKSDRCGSGLMLSLHALLDLTLHLTQNRMMRRPSCQVERKHRRRPLKQSGRGQQGSSGGAGTAAGRQRKRQTASRLQDHLRYQLAGVRLSLGERSVRSHQSLISETRSPREEEIHLITGTLESCAYQGCEKLKDIWRR